MWHFLTSSFSSNIYYNSSVALSGAPCVIHHPDTSALISKNNTEEQSDRTLWCVAAIRTDTLLWDTGVVILWEVPSITFILRTFWLKKTQENSLLTLNLLRVFFFLQILARIHTSGKVEASWVLTLSWMFIFCFYFNLKFKVNNNNNRIKTN